MTAKNGYDLTHKKLLESSKIFFLKKGFKGANLREICRHSGVTTGAFYRHFKDKESLFSELVEPLVKDILYFHAKFEKQSLDELENGNQYNISEVNYYSSVKVGLHIFNQKEIFELLIKKSQGTQYENFIEEFVTREDENHRKALDIFYTKYKINVTISDEIIHLLNYSYINTLSNILIYSKSASEVEEKIKTVAVFFNEGWKKLIGY